MEKTIGFIGLGRMGAAIAGRLLAHGYRLTIWNRTPEKARPLLEKGAIWAERPEETALPGGIVVSMLADDTAVEEIFGPRTGLLPRLGPEGVHVSLSTIGSATARRLAQMHERFGVALVAAPVFGRPDAAAAGSLVVVCSGPAEARQRVAPLLAVIGRATFDFGDLPEAACVAKLCGNFLLAAAVEALAEALALAEKSGVDPQRWLEMVTTTLFACPAYQNYGRILNERRFQPAGFTLRLGVKDLRLILDEGRRHLVPLPAADLIHDRLQAAWNRGRAEWDWSAVALEAFEAAGLSGRPAAADAAAGAEAESAGS
jgi:3-hydroxyisobutyrate dehydrogenase-like beta-hydroxyacid dehydrogenase